MHSLSRDQAIESICLPRNSRGVHRPVLVGRRTRRQFCFTRVNRDFRFACPRWPLYTPKGSVAHETLVRHSIVPLQRPSAQLGRPCDPLKSLVSRETTTIASGRGSPHSPGSSRPQGSRGAARAARQPAGTGSAQILCSMSPNSRRVRCPSASRSEQEPVAPGMLHQPTSSFYQPLLETRERPALDPRRQDQSAPEVAQVVGQDAQLQAHFVRPETMARQPRPLGGLLAFFDPLLRRDGQRHN